MSGFSRGCLRIDLIAARLLLLVFMGIGSRADTIHALAPGAPLDYTAFAMQPESWRELGYSLQLTPWEGKNVVFLTTDERLNQRLMGVWVSQLDAGWRVYADLTGRLPEPYRHLQGKVTIAAVPTPDLTCGAGCGYLGLTGIELARFYEYDYPALRKQAKAMPHYAFYEMGRNFYTFGDRHSCFTTGFAVFMRYVCMDALKCEDVDLPTREIIEGLEKRFRKSGLGFLELFTNPVGKNPDRLADGTGATIRPSDQAVCYAAAMLRLRRENGGDEWVRRFFRHLATCPESDPKTEAGALRQGFYWMICASLAAQKDLGPVFAGDWHFPLTPEQRSLMARADWARPNLTVHGVAEVLARAK